MIDLIKHGGQWKITPRSPSLLAGSASSERGLLSSTDESRPSTAGDEGRESVDPRLFMNTPCVQQEDPDSVSFAGAFQEGTQSPVTPLPALYDSVTPPFLSRANTELAAVLARSKRPEPFGDLPPADNYSVRFWSGLMLRMCI